MCGLIGAAGSLTFTEETAFKQLMVVNSLRGSDSTGVASINRQSETKIAKQVGSPFDLMDMPAFKNAFTGAVKVLIGHGRYATTGKVLKRNAHPFDFETLVGAHNGTLQNKWSFVNGADYDTDSEALYDHIHEKGLRNAIDIAKGAYALTWFDKNKNTMNLLRNTERTLWFTLTEDQRCMFWSSEAWMLRGILARNDIKHGEIYDLPPNRHYSWELPVNGAVLDKPHVTEMEPKVFEVAPAHVPFSKTSSVGGPANTSRPASNVITHPSIQGKGKGAHEIVKERSENKGVYNMAIVDGLLLHLKVLYWGKNEHGATYVEMECQRFPSHHFKVFVKSEKECKLVMGAPYWVGKVKEVCQSKTRGGYYKVGYDTMVMPKDHYTRKMLEALPPAVVEQAKTICVKDHKGAVLTRAEYQERYQDGCLWCTTPVDFEEVGQIVSSDQVLCCGCARDTEIQEYLPHIMSQGALC